jgi:hypothetical protein
MMRVETSSTFLIDMVRKAASGSLGLAPFQRQYVWTKDDVEQLMKSMINKWPLGSFTLWTPGQAHIGQFPTKGRLGPVEHPEDVETLVLDGQNRLSSLIYASLLSSATPNPTHPYSEQELDVWFGGEILVADAETKSVAFRTPDQAFSPTAAPFGLILDAFVFGRGRQFELLNLVERSGMTDAHMDWLMNDIPNTVREARITVADLRDATLEEARDCYMTICRSGQPISDAEFDMAFSYAVPASSSKGMRP